MGSLNIKCNLTEASIIPNELMLLIPIIENIPSELVELYKDDESDSIKIEPAEITSSSSSMLWTALNCPIFGKYDDYARMELNEEERNIKRLISLIHYIIKYGFNIKNYFNKNILINLLEQKNYILLSKKLQEYSFKNLLFIRDSTHIRRLNFMSISRFAYDELLKQNTNLCNNNFENGMREYMASEFSMDNAKFWDNNLGRVLLGKYLFDNVQQLPDTSKVKKNILKFHVMPFIECRSVFNLLDTYNKVVHPIRATDQDYSNENFLNYMKILKKVERNIKRINGNNLNE